MSAKKYLARTNMANRNKREEIDSQGVIEGEDRNEKKKKGGRRMK